MTSKKDKFLKSGDFEKALARLDLEMAKDDYLNAFAPINVVSAGGYLAVSYFKNREATGDLDYMIDPEWSKVDEIKSPLKAVIRTVAKKEKFEADWMNDGLEIWATPEACKKIFKEAYEQNILLFDGKSLRVWAAPFRWALERKIRRIAYSDRGIKDVDMNDALALFRHFRESNNGPLDMEYFRNLNMNGFDIVPGIDQMEKIATNYRGLYEQDLFSTPAQATSHMYSSHAAGSWEPTCTADPAASIAESSHATTSADSWAPTYTADPGASTAESSHATSPAVSWTPTYATTSAVSADSWGDWVWSDQYGCHYRSRPNAAEPNGYEYDYDQTAGATSSKSQRKGKGKAKR